MNYVKCLYGMAVFIAVVAPVSTLPDDREDYKTCFKEEMASRSPTYNEDCSSDYYQEYDYSIFINPGYNNTDCNLQQLEKNTTMVCSDINTALKFHRNSTAYVLASDANITHSLK